MEIEREPDGRWEMKMEIDCLNLDLVINPSESKGESELESELELE